ncbi:mannan endo-1,6-alpha-mannosidase [Ascobolus immersus RN42]|uniref:Mannan endo-1,6-alpha-mannosidase n=1 Tax=Ascobolus immersus RN42 TaxID=1160509 RepID=A0A3N4ICI8_ASCIM|nr:mannan endo-1,6-alpha-mannosidase [Ascobolus immersus RN42]
MVVSRGVNAQVNVLEVDPDNRDSILKWCKQSVERIWTYYPGEKYGETPGVIPGIYWWEAGAMFGTLIDYWWYSDDKTHEKAIQDALIHQADKDNGWMYEPRNRTLELGNDDQGYWAIAVMAAAEKRFPEVPPERGPGWLALAQRVFEAQAGRWDEEACNGGLHWQIHSTNVGYDYKNTVSNGLYFQLAARLARYTGNQTYAEIADKVWDWMESDRHYINSTTGAIYDGAHLPECKNIVPYEWSYNSGIVVAGAAYMWNITGEAKWRERVELILNHALTFFSRDDIPHLTWEYTCETNNSCDQDQRWFKGHLHRFLGLVYQLCPFTQPMITPKFKETARWAPKTCYGGPAGDRCGFRWWFEGGGVFDGIDGVSVESSTLEVVQSALLTVPRPNAETKPKWIYKASDGGVASRNITELESSEKGMRKLKVITDGQRAGAWIMTIIMVAMALGLVWFVAPNK